MLTRKHQITSDTTYSQFSQQIVRDKKGNLVKNDTELTPNLEQLSSSMSANQLRQMKKQQEYRQKEIRRNKITFIQNNPRAFQYPKVNKESPYRSMGRITRLLKNNDKSSKKAQSFIVQKVNSPPKSDFKMKEMKDLAVGQKRQSETSNDKLELESQFLTIETKADSQELLNSQTQKANISTFSFADEEGFEIVQPMGQIADWKSKPIFLKSTKTNEKFQFVLHNEDTLKFMEDALKFTPDRKINDYCLDKLEIEYDYDTDEEQIFRAKKHLLTEQKMAVEFYVKDDPIMLIGNLKYSQVKMNEPKE